MDKNTRTLGLIPARGGSKRVPRKNIRNISNKPLIAHTIEQANKASAIDRTVVSTDDDEISTVAKEYGADVPFQRPKKLATDTTTNTNVVAHALNWFEEVDEKFDVVCMLLATNPFRTVTDIDSALNQLIESDARSIIAVTEYDISPMFALQINAQNMLDPLFDKEYFISTTRTQDVPNYTHPNGSLYAAEVDAFRDSETFFTGETAAYEMPQERSFDIDTLRDLKIAKKMMEEDQI